VIVDEVKIPKFTLKNKVTISGTIIGPLLKKFFFHKPEYKT